MDLGLAGKRALVGGGGSGLGRGIAEVLAADGARVAIVGRTQSRVEEVARTLDAVPVLADLATADGPADAVAHAVEGLGGLDLLVVNTGGPPPGNFDALDEDAWTSAIDGTLRSAVRLIRAGLPHLRAGHEPAIAVLLSSSVREPIPGLTTSNTLRPGIVGLIKSLTAEIAPIRINGVATGRFATDRMRTIDERRAASQSRTLDEVREAAEAAIPLRRSGDPAEMGRVVAFLLSPAASYVTGAIVPVDGGMVRALP